MIQLKIAKDENVEEYIPLIRKIDRTLSRDEIQKRIENDEFVIEHEEIPAFGFHDDINDIDRIISFRTLVDTLTQNGVSIQAFLDEDQISLEILYDLLETLQRIKIEDNYRRITI